MEASHTSVITRARANTALPVLMKEMRSRMRGMRAPVLLFITTGLAILVGLLIITPSWDSLYRDSEYLSRSMADIGKNLFYGLVILEAILCAVIAPALTAGAVSTEREQQTLDLLLLTRLSNANILLGKLISSLSFVVMVLLCVLPVAAISFLLGGVDPAQFIWSLAIILTTVILFGVIGLYCSTRYQKTVTAVAVAYCACVIWLALVPLFVGLFEVFRNIMSSENMQTSYVIFTVVCAGVLAVIPMAILSLLTSLIMRRAATRWTNIIFWVVCAGGGIWMMLSSPVLIEQIIENHPEYTLVGNPVVAMIQLLGGEMFSSSSPSIIAQWFPQLTASLLLLGAWVVLMLTVIEFRKLRH